MDILGDPYVVQSQIIELVWLLIHLGIMVLLVVFFDRAVGLDFKAKIVPHLEGHPLAGAIFSAAVILAIALLVKG